MAIGFVQSWNLPIDDVTGTVTLPVDGATANNLLILSINIRATPRTLTTPPAGYTLLEDSEGDVILSHTVWHFYRWASGTSDDDVNAVINSGSRLKAFVSEYSGLTAGELPTAIGPLVGQTGNQSVTTDSIDGSTDAVLLHSCNNWQQWTTGLITLTPSGTITTIKTAGTTNYPGVIHAMDDISGPKQWTITTTSGSTGNYSFMAVAFSGGVVTPVVEPDDLSQSQTLTNVTLTHTPPTFAISAAGLSQDQTLDSVTLTYVGVTLAIDGLSQSQTISQVDVDFYPPTGTISPSGLIQNQTVDNVTLTYTPETVTITGADLSQGQTTSSVIIVYSPPFGIIAPEAIYQQQLIDNVTLTYTPPLVTLQIDDAEQMQFITSVRFGGLAEGTMSGKVRTELAIKGLTIVYH